MTTDQLRVSMKEHHVVVRIERGQSEWWNRGRVWNGGPGAVHLKQPGDVHRDVAHDGTMTYQAVVLPESDIQRVYLEGKVLAHPHFKPGDERGLPFQRLLDAVAAGADRLTLEVAVVEAVQAFTVLRGATPDHTRPVRRAMAYLHERMGDAVTLDDLAAHAGLDKFHLCRAFRAQIGLPPHAYLTHLRIMWAKELLQRGLRASEVATRVGFYDQSQLNRHFRRIVGTTPARFGNARLRHGC
ncbi:AraC family transcriptional regulator [Corallococcus sp. EGB]|uniref:helix-turn-helix domain-containing protein n=1 Tax=Corallococcus sp. EGB TaxID=1521117 RepID=UPI001CBB2786|nr:AraC family transcriptional regulator [Corallococcus sp. EGB]